MLRPEVDWLRCQLCDPCLARPVCKVRAVVKFDLDEPAYIDQTRCNGCGNCVGACPHEAITMRNGSTPRLP